MREGWEVKSFEDCIVKVKYTTKVQSIDYLEEGLYPIISQEEELISGYWNIDSDVFKVTTPVVIFGDHTRVLKYVDFDFVLGADGVKILLPISGINAKYLLYFLMASRIPSLGYSRHYKLLKELSIPIPPLPLQEKIVSELDLLSGVIEKKRQQLKELDNLAQSIFYDMFGDPITNEMGWEVKKLGEVCKLKAGKSIKASELSEEYIDGLYPCYGGNGIRGYIQKNSHEGTLPIIGRQGALCGNVVLARNEFYATEHAVVCTPIITIDNIWLYWALLFCKLNRFAQGVAQPGISVGIINEMYLPLPPLPLQQSFAAKVEAIEQQKALIKQSLAETETLFNSRMEHYFGEGE